MRYLIRFAPTESPRDERLASVRAIAKAVGADPRNPMWTSYGALELDVFVPTRADIETFLAALGPMVSTEFVRDLSIAPPYRRESELFAEAKVLFNAERYWECHEVLEGIWRTKLGDEKRLLQGIILVCAAFVHHQKGEDEVGMGVLRRAVKQLDFPAREYGGFDVSKLRDDVGSALRDHGFVNFRI